VRYLNDAYATEWLDNDYKAMQDKVDSMLPNTINLLTPPIRPESPWMLVNAYADIWPNRTMLYNRETHKLEAGQPSGHTAAADGAHHAGSLQGARWPEYSPG
jgi:hypothetical protein